ncbi:MAG: helix-turn-helix transcriptional regulator [Oscillospiraceae bacterium]|nr:helix-turn-helix transcriptional regulator [Oscillospiraceae bacterium]
MSGKVSGDYLRYHLNWEADEMVLTDAGGQLRNRIELVKMPMSPVFRSLRLLANGNYNEHCRFTVDVECGEGGDSALLYLRRTDNFNSVVNVARSLVHQVLRGQLTTRETEVATLLFEGSTIRYIAGHLQIAEGTVKRLMHNIYQKLNVASQVELIRFIYDGLAQNAAIGEDIKLRLCSRGHPVCRYSDCSGCEMRRGVEEAGPRGVDGED